MDVWSEAHQGNKPISKDNKPSEALSFAKLVIPKAGDFLTLVFRRKNMPKAEAGDESKIFRAKTGD